MGGFLFLMGDPSVNMGLNTKSWDWLNFSSSMATSDQGGLSSVLNCMEDSILSLHYWPVFQLMHGDVPVSP